MKTLINPWKGLKLKAGSCRWQSQSKVKTLINPWKGLKRDGVARGVFEAIGENPNKSLEGIKTCGMLLLTTPGKRENPNKSLEGIKTSIRQSYPSTECVA